MLNTFFDRNRNKLILIHPNANDPSQLEVNVNNLKMTRKRDESCFNSFKNSITSSLTYKIEKCFVKKIDKMKFGQSEIYEIDSCKFDEGDNDYETYLSINYRVKFLKTYSLEFKEKQLKTKLLYNLDFSNEHSSIKSHSLSRLIRGETAILLNDEVYLRNESNSASIKIATELRPKWDSIINSWQSIKFGLLHPRQFLYTDQTQFISIDSRIRNKSLKRDLFTANLQTNYLNPNELILKTEPVENSSHLNLILCSDTLVLSDERNLSIPLLSWKHFLKNNGPIYLNNWYLPIDGGLNCVSCANSSNECYLYHFGTAANCPPVSFNYTLKLDDFSDYMRSLSDFNCNMQINRILKRRLLQDSVISLSPLKYQDNCYSLFRVSIF